MKPNSAAVRSYFEHVPMTVLVDWYNKSSPGKGIKKFENRGKAVNRTIESLLNAGLVVIDEDLLRQGGNYNDVFGIDKGDSPNAAPEPEQVSPADLPADVPAGSRKLSSYSIEKTKEPRRGTKGDILVRLITRAEGMTDKEGSEAVDWNGCSITATRAAQRAGYDVYSHKDPVRGTVYYARKPIA